uniref:Uncharacterized protein n=1 Tax=viral metagenome TaxID=1070528 RepID=A0A2V0RBM2_9ZZZZ
MSAMNFADDGAHMIAEADILKGSFGPQVDQYLGQSPIDGPPGYTFQKVYYSAQGVAQTDSATVTQLTAIYQKAPAHTGLLLNSNGTTSSIGANDMSLTLINQDQAGGSGISNSNRLESGDFILGALLRAIDTKPDDTRQGNFTAGYAAVGKLTRGSSPFPPILASNHIVFETFGVPADHATKVHQRSNAISNELGISHASTAVSCTNGLEFHNMTQAMGLTGKDSVSGASAADKNLVDTKAPVLAIVADGIAGADQIKVSLCVYALVAPRVDTGEAIQVPNRNFKLHDVAAKCKPQYLSYVA